MQAKQLEAAAKEATETVHISRNTQTIHALTKEIVSQFASIRDLQKMSRLAQKREQAF